MAVNHVFISLCCLLLTAFFFPRADFSFFQGAERTHAAVVNTARATYLPQSVIKLYYFISCNHVYLTSKWGHCFSKLSWAAQVVMFISTVNEWWPPADALRRKRPSSSLLKSKQKGVQKIWGNMKQLWKPKTLPYQENGSDFSQEYLLICCRYVLEDGRWGNKIVRSKKRSMKTNDGFIPCILSGRKAMEVKPQSSLWFLESLLQTLHFYIVLLPFSTLTAGMVSLFKVPWSIGCRVSAW